MSDMVNYMIGYARRKIVLPYMTHNCVMDLSFQELENWEHWGS